MLYHEVKHSAPKISFLRQNVALARSTSETAIMPAAMPGDVEFDLLVRYLSFSQHQNKPVSLVRHRFVAKEQEYTAVIVMGVPNSQDT